MKFHTLRVAFLLSSMSSPPSTMSSAAVSTLSGSMAFASGISNDAPDHEGASSSDVPQLPESDPDAKIPTIKLGETISLEEMGPVIINTDGTTRRIDNWDQLSEAEKKTTWRRISQRNEKRRKKLLEEQQQQQQAKEAQQDL